jgi:ribosomal protein L11 methyltransferase
MNQEYTVHEFMTRSEEQREILISILPELGFDGFEEGHESLKAYIPAVLMVKDQLAVLLLEYELDDIACHVDTIAPRNWNEEWEKSFEPVTIADTVHIRASFHTPSQHKYDLVIDPKMSFGTGHHATTALMMEWMLGATFKDMDVLDFGCGTGILAILAEKLGAQSVLGIDNEDWACENSRENALVNHCHKIEIRQAHDTVGITGRYGIILANINRNIILDHIMHWQQLLLPEGTLVLSGLLYADEAVVEAQAVGCGLMIGQVYRQDGWIAIVLNNNK